MSTALAEESEASTREYRIYRQRVDGNGQPWDWKARQRSSGTPTMPPNYWPWPSMSRAVAIAKIEAEQSQFSASGYCEEGDYYWARNHATRDGDLVVWRWRLVDWS